MVIRYNPLSGHKTPAKIMQWSLDITEGSRIRLVAREGFPAYDAAP
jgi:hypothetical protein